MTVPNIGSYVPTLITVITLTTLSSVNDYILYLMEDKSLADGSPVLFSGRREEVEDDDDSQAEDDAHHREDWTDQEHDPKRDHNRLVYLVL
jgi:hypothetical protein